MRSTLYSVAETSDSLDELLDSYEPVRRGCTICNGPEEMRSDIDQFYARKVKGSDARTGGTRLSQAGLMRYLERAYEPLGFKEGVLQKHLKRCYGSKRG